MSLVIVQTEGLGIPPTSSHSKHPVPICMRILTEICLQRFKYKLLQGGDFVREAFWASPIRLGTIITLIFLPKKNMIRVKR